MRSERQHVVRKHDVDDVYEFAVTACLYD